GWLSGVICIFGRFVVVLFKALRLVRTIFLRACLIIAPSPRRRDAGGILCKRPRPCGAGWERGPKNRMHSRLLGTVFLMEIREMRIGMMVDMYKPYLSGVINCVSLNKRWLENRGHDVFVFTFGSEA